MKSPAAKKVLQLMDEDVSYKKAVETALELYPDTNKVDLEKELNQYI